MNIVLYLKMFVAFITAFASLITGPASAIGQSDICMIAHRGYSGIYPENTALAFEKAADAGFGGAETDVRVTADGVYVLSHNSDAEFEDGTEMAIADHTYEELTAQPLNNKKTSDTVYLCTFEEYLEIMEANDMICFIELKGDYTKDQVKGVFDLVIEVYDLQKCILQSFEFDNLISARELFPDLPLMLTYDEDFGDYSKCFEYNISIDTDYNCLTEEMVEDFHAHGLQVGAWTADELFSLSYCKSCGVDYIESDLFGTC